MAKMNRTKSIWLSLRRSMHCESEPAEVHDPKKRQWRSKSGGCSKSISNLRDVIHGGSNRRSMEMQMRESCSSPRSISSSDFLNPIAHEVVLSNSVCEIKISTHSDAGAGADATGSFLGTLRPGTPGPGGHPTMHYFGSYSPMRKPHRLPSLDAAAYTADEKTKIKFSAMAVKCNKCGEQFRRWETAEAHHLSLHAVTELVEGESSRKIVEIICRASWGKGESPCRRIERVLKIHNMQRTVGRFEEYREMVKAKAGRLQKKHPRCLADGNELLRFHGTSFSCSLGSSASSSSLCFSENCSVCNIIQHGFSSKEKGGRRPGVFTASTCGRALQRAAASSEIGEEEEEDCRGKRMAVIVCRVIAGRVQKALEKEEMGRQMGFDSVVGKVGGVYSSMEELYALNPRAVLPCFVVICRL